METDSSCRCKPGYEFLVNGETLSDDNGTPDCQPLVYDRCSSDQYRNSNGVCVSDNDCSSACEGGSGVRSPSTGMCQCDTVQPLDTICNRSCRLALPQVTLLSTSTVTVTTQDETTEINLLLE